MDFDLIIIGGGIVGAAAAYRAGQLGARTLLCDRRDAGRATDAGAGILAPESSTRDGRLWYDFALDAVRYYSVLIEDLTADGVPVEELSLAYSHCSKLMVALDDVEVAALAEMEQTIYARQEERRPPSAERIRRISSTEARNAFYPLLADATAVLIQPLARRVDGRLMTAALERGLRKRGRADSRCRCVCSVAGGWPRTRRAHRCRRRVYGWRGSHRRRRLVNGLRQTAGCADSRCAPKGADHPSACPRSGQRRLVDRERVQRPLSGALAGRSRRRGRDAGDRQRIRGPAQRLAESRRCCMRRCAWRPACATPPSMKFAWACAPIRSIICRFWEPSPA